MQANSPDPAKIPPEDAVGVTVVLLTCSYKGSEFVRVGYYVNNEYADPELAENAPGKPIFEKVALICQSSVGGLIYSASLPKPIQSLYVDWKLSFCTITH